MATHYGRVGAVSVTAGINTLLYTVPSGIAGTLRVKVNICNKASSTVIVRIALLRGGISTLSGIDYIWYDTAVGANCPSEETDIPMAIGDSIVVRSDTSGTVFQALAEDWG